MAENTRQMGVAAVPDTDPALGFPEPFTIHDFGGSPSEYVDCLYAEYRAMVDRADIRLWGKPLGSWAGTAKDGRDGLFWHLITTGPAADRRLNLARCARLNLIRPMLVHLAHDNLRVCWWPQKLRHRRRWHLMVAPVDFTYVVVLREDPTCVLLSTAYPVGRRHRQRLMKRAAAAWIDCQSEKWRERPAVAQTAA